VRPFSYVPNIVSIQS